MQNKNCTYGNDNTKTDELEFKKADGTILKTPNRWTKQWIQGLSNNDFWLILNEIFQGQTAGYW